jgi:site-specific recombinase XerD
MTSLPPLLQGFFSERLARQRGASPHTIAAYRDSFRLLLTFVHEQTGRAPSKLTVEDLDAATITAFLSHLETKRGNSVRTRNARLTAIHSFFHYAAWKAPEQAELIARVLAIPEKRFDTTLISYLSEPEVEALLAAPDRSTWTGRRDHALLLLAVQTGLRVTELGSLRCQDLQLDDGAYVQCRGKGRKERCTPLARQTKQVLRSWVRELSGPPGSPLFPNRRGQHLTRGAIWRLVHKHALTARERCPSLVAKNITPHVLRHTAAMRLLHTPSPVDVATIALWLGHENLDTTNKYIHADMELKRRALDRVTPLNAKPGRYRPPDPLLAFLESLK